MPDNRAQLLTESAVICKIEKQRAEYHRRVTFFSKMFFLQILNRIAMKPVRLGFGSNVPRAHRICIEKSNSDFS